MLRHFYRKMVLRTVIYSPKQGLFLINVVDQYMWVCRMMLKNLLKTTFHAPDASGEREGSCGAAVTQDTLNRQSWNFHKYEKWRRDYFFLRIITFKFKTVRDLFISLLRLRISVAHLELFHASCLVMTVGESGTLSITRRARQICAIKRVSIPKCNIFSLSRHEFMVKNCWNEAKCATQVRSYRTRSSDIVTMKLN